MITMPYVLIGTAILVGAGSAVLWNAQASFLAQHGDDESYGLLAGLFFFVFAFTSVGGNFFAAVFFANGGTTNTFILVLTLVALSSYVPFAFMKDPLIISPLNNNNNNNNNDDDNEFLITITTTDSESSTTTAEEIESTTQKSSLLETLRLFCDLRITRSADVLVWICKCFLVLCCAFTNRYYNDVFSQQ